MLMPNEAQVSIPKDNIQKKKKINKKKVIIKIRA